MTKPVRRADCRCAGPCLYPIVSKGFQPSAICSECKWTNTSLINLGIPGEPRWVCLGCCKRLIDGRDTHSPSAIEKAARELVVKLKLVHDDPTYRGVWTHYQLHFPPYNGPTYGTEFDALEWVIKEADDYKHLA